MKPLAYLLVVLGYGMAYTGVQHFAGTKTTFMHNMGFDKFFSNPGTAQASFANNLKTLFPAGSTPSSGAPSDQPYSAAPPVTQTTAVGGGTASGGAPTSTGGVQQV